MKQAKHQITRGALTGTGSTKAEAKADLDHRVNDALSADYLPIVVRFRATVLIGYRAPEGWAYGRPRDDGGSALVVSCSPRQWPTEAETRRKLESAMRYHAAQLEWNGTEETSPVFASVDPDDFKHERAEFARWARWQKAYRAARESGADDEEARLTAHRAMAA